MTVHNWLNSVSRFNRQAGLHIWLSLLTAYIDVRQENEVFTFTNELLSTVAVRCADSDLGKFSISSEIGFRSDLTFRYKVVTR